MSRVAGEAGGGANQDTDGSERVDEDRDDRGGVVASGGAGRDEVSPTLAALFDLRSVITLLFGVYGVVLTVLGALDGPDELAKAGGIRINLWTGLAMLVLAAGFAAWVAARPPVPRRR